LNLTWEDPDSRDLTSISLIHVIKPLWLIRIRDLQVAYGLSEAITEFPKCQYDRLQGNLVRQF